MRLVGLSSADLGFWILRGARFLYLTSCLILASLASGAPQPGDRLEPFTLQKREGEAFDWKPGQVAVLSCCAFWCDTWKDQLPRVAQARKALGGLPVSFLTISVDGRWTERAEKASSGTMLSDPGGRWSEALKIDRVPYTFVVDKSGTVVWASFGTVRSDELVKAVRGALEGKGGGGIVYLTFDDFPSEKGSDELLDLLRAEHAPATFFCIGSRAEANARLLKRAVKEGHELEMHSWAHEAAKPDLARCVSVMEAITGQKPSLYRPPGSEKVLRMDGSALAFRVVDPYDFSRPGADEVARRVELQVRADSIIQLHAGVSDTLEALPGILENLRKRGFELKLLGP